MIAPWLVVAAAAVAAYTDVRWRKIPNALVAVLLVSGLALRAAQSPWSAVIGVAIFAAALAAGSLVFAAGIAGGGDVKFIAAASAALGWPHALAFVAYTCIAGAFLAILAAGVRGQLGPLLRNVGASVFALAGGMRNGVVATSGVRMPYALAILTGALAVALGHLLSLNPRFYS